MNFKKASIYLIALLLLAACRSAAEETGGGSDIHWSYEGEEGPAHWGELDPGFAACGVGDHQSPIDVTTTDERDVANIEFHYQQSDVLIVNNGHTVQVDYEGGSYIELDGNRFDVLQFHYHAPSEHAVNGELFAAELHIVHANADDRLAVVGILLAEGEENAAYTSFIDNLPAEETEGVETGDRINALELLPDVQTTYRYSGSLTTPPCSEGVLWLLMTTPVELSGQQIAAMETVFEGNNRPVQPIFERTVTEDTTP